ncbi:hypothetical protein LNQ82_02660 [Conchiformibius steedae DSM 2580]|uniref:Uncharacterized protein n=1 Tax=Conchiformibius steedae DSM 2580 TaxID=1121352 RepID=A0AAE9HWX6_9NEIS|nr:hypothetical protein [Conchiformibius steedae]QMT33430.1 hypothetical protein H3L98_10185 [Conchiformibius steedae]URD68081.1 hypothetical protein LNQ82_02660 [Conchiformibius steedae DSM 2580]
MPSARYTLLLFSWVVCSTAPAEVLLINGFYPANCHNRFYSETGNPSLIRTVVVGKTEHATALSFDNQPPQPFSQTVKQWLLTQAQALLADAPAAISPLRPIIPPKMADDLACRDRAKLLLQTLHDAAAENRRHMDDKHYIPYDIQGWFTHLQSDDELIKILQ